MFKQWVNEVIDYEGYRHRVLLSDDEGYTIDSPNHPEYVEQVTGKRSIIGVNIIINRPYDIYKV